MQTITATELARNTRAVLDTVASRGETVAIERNQTLIAQIIPPQRTMTASQALAGLALPGLAFPILTPAQATAWLKDSKDGFGDAVRDPWA
jgi:antitoxin (DNA-binding transcriptional repressor) of toxin-antitoxin stability system